MAKLGERKFPDLYNRTWLEERYVARSESVGVIARELGCSSSAVSIALKRAGIPVTHNARGQQSVRHGHVRRENGRRSPSRTYRSWQAMITRCTNPKVDSYARYGARGIMVCERWRVFANFLADMGERPEGKTLDRIDSKGDYEPGNVRWADPSTQAQNRSAAAYAGTRRDANTGRFLPKQ